MALAALLAPAIRNACAAGMSFFSLACTIGAFGDWGAFGADAPAPIEAQSGSAEEVWNGLESGTARHLICPKISIIDSRLHACAICKCICMYMYACICIYCKIYIYMRALPLLPKRPWVYALASARRPAHGGHRPAPPRALGKRRHACSQKTPLLPGWPLGTLQGAHGVSYTTLYLGTNISGRLEVLLGALQGAQR